MHIQNYKNYIATLSPDRLKKELEKEQMNAHAPGYQHPESHFKAIDVKIELLQEQIRRG